MEGTPTTLCAKALTVLLTGLALAGCAGAPAAPAVGGSASASGCRAGNPLANVYHPSRLQVLAACKTVTGTVEGVRAETDGDEHVAVRLDAAYANLINAANTADQHGDLVVEIVPADEPGCKPGTPPRAAHGSYDYGVCTGADLTPPSVGRHISVTGPYVLDRDHGWMEIHPVWALQVGGGAGGVGG